jgi:DNA-binding transcriptional LysR family regulator
MARASGVPSYTLAQLAAFVAVADSGTIAGAAARLHLSPSAVGAALTDLERALQAQLCVRHRAKGVVLTFAGKAVLAKARTLLHEALELEFDVRGEPGQVSGVLHVGCYTTLGPSALPPLLARFGERYPATKVELREDTLDGLRRAVDARELDLAIVYDIDLPRHWNTAPLLQAAPRVHLAAGHPLATGSDPVSLVDLADEPMILLDAPPSREHQLECCRSAGVEPRVGFRTSSFETARALVGRGLGWTLLVQRTPVDVTYEGRPIAVKDVAEAMPVVSMVLAWHGDNPLSRAAQAFLQLAAANPENSEEAFFQHD